MSKKPVHRKGRKRRLLSIGLVFAALAWGVGLPFFVERMISEPTESKIRTDAIVALTGGTMRLETAISLLEADFADRLFISGVHRGVEAREIAGFAAKDPTVFECCVILGRDAEDTTGNASETAGWISGRDIGSIRLVTAAYHMPRALLEMRAVLPDVTIVPHPVFPERVKLDAWYRYPGTTVLLSAEYSKYLLASVRIAFAGFWLGQVWAGSAHDGSSFNIVRDRILRVHCDWVHRDDPDHLDAAHLREDLLPSLGSNFSTPD